MAYYAYYENRVAQNWATDSTKKSLNNVLQVFGEEALRYPIPKYFDGIIYVKALKMSHEVED